jgi:PAS domain S-box-containing protein
MSFLSELSFEHFFRNTDAIILITDAEDGKLIDVNDAAIRFYRYTLEQFRSMKTSDIVQQTKNSSALYDNSSRGVIELHKNAEGKIRTVKVITSSCNFGDATHLVSIVDDITDEVNGQSNPESVSKEREEQYEEAFQSNPVAQAVTKIADGEFIAVNKHFCTFFGYSNEELIGTTTFMLQMWENSENRASVIKQLQHSGQVRMLETTIRIHSGEIRNIMLSMERILWKGVPCIISSIVDITERKQAEEKQWEISTRLEAALSSMTDAVFISDINCNFLEFNEAFATFHRLKSKSECARTLAEYPGFLEVYFEDGTLAPLDMWAVPRSLRGETVTNAEYILRRKDTGESWVGSYNFAPIRDKDGTIVGSVVVGRDITVQKNIERARCEAQRRYEMVIESITDNFFALDDQLHFTHINTSALRYFNFSRSEVIGKTPYELSPTFKGSDFEKTFLEVKSMMQPVHKEIESKTRQKTLELHAYPGPENITVIFRDITERRLQAISLAAEKERLSVTLRSIGDGVITTDTAGNVVLINKVAEQLTGWTQQDAEGKPLPEVFYIVNEFTRKRCENPVEKVLKTGSVVELSNHTILISRDGREIVLADSGAPIMDKDNHIIGTVLVFRDMTEKSKLEETMQRIDKLDSLSVLAGGIAHDFNNLLGGIFGYLDLAREETATDSPASKYLDKALTVFNRAKDLTMQLLTFSKDGTPIRKVTNIGPLIKENASFVLTGTNVRYHCTVSDDIRLCEIDQNQIGQVIDNIVINAQQAMPLGGTIIITVENVTITNTKFPSLHAGPYILISITDSGIGIPREHIKRIFDPFFTTKQKGNGLGLATSYSIIQKHDGLIDVESQIGKGTTFRIYLPASNSNEETAIHKTMVTHKGSGTILVMDDEDFMREVIERMLVSMGYSVICVKNGQEAITTFSNNKDSREPIKVAILDLTIPGGMGGMELISKLKPQYPQVFFFAASGFSENPLMSRPQEFGFTGSVRKPFKKAELAALLDLHFGKS